MAATAAAPSAPTENMAAAAAAPSAPTEPAGPDASKLGLRYRVVSKEAHRELMTNAWLHRGYNEVEAAAATDICEQAAWYGVSSHNGLKALDVDDKFGAGATPQGCLPGSPISKRESRFGAVQSWDASGSAFVAAIEAVDACMVRQGWGYGVREREL